MTTTTLPPMLELPYETCDLKVSFDARILSASATYSLISNYQGNITVADPEGDIGENYILRRYSIDVSVDSSVCDDTELTLDQVNCLSGTIKIASGIISNISYSVDHLGARQADISLDSFFARTNSRAISTEPFYQIDANSVLEDICTIYLGIPADLIDMNAVPRFISGPCDGNNALEELRAIAQAGLSHLFVQTNGKLTAEPWLACEAAEFDIPCAVINSASRVMNNEIPPTVIRVRGGHIQSIDCGETNFTDTRTSSVAGRAGYESLGGGVGKTVYTGIPQSEAEVSFFNLSADKKDLFNANIATEGLNNDSQYTSLSQIVDIQDGKYTFRVTGGEREDFLGKGSKEFYTKIAGKMTPDDFKKKRKDKQSKKDNVKTAKQVRRLSDVLSNRPPVFESGPAFGSGMKGGVGHNDADNSGAEGSRTQLEVLVIDPVLIDIHGVKEEQIDNPYVICKEDLFRIGVRRFQQWRMEQNAWEVELAAALPCLRINQMVTFTPPPSAQVPAPTAVKGVISGISYDYSPPSVTQKLTILGVDSLCDTTYTSSNLIPNFCGVNGDSGSWTGSGTTNQQMGNISNDALLLYSGGVAGVSFVFLTQECMEVGGEYVISFQAEFLDGVVSALAFKVADSAANTIASSAIPITGTYTYAFTATDDTCVFRWDLATVGTSNFWKIFNIQLIKSTVA